MCDVEIGKYLCLEHDFPAVKLCDYKRMPRIGLLAFVICPTLSDSFVAKFIAACINSGIFLNILEKPWGWFSFEI